MNHHRGGKGFLSSKFANTSQPIFFETNQSIRTKKNLSSNNAEAGKVDHQRFRCEYGTNATSSKEVSQVSQHTFSKWRNEYAGHIDNATMLVTFKVDVLV
jgi:hypothetical protein